MCVGECSVSDQLRTECQTVMWVVWVRRTQTNSESCIVCSLGNPRPSGGTKKLQSSDKIYLGCLGNKTCLKAAITFLKNANFSWVASLLLTEYMTLTEHIASWNHLFIIQRKLLLSKMKNLFCQNEVGVYCFPKTHLITSGSIRQFLLPPHQSAVLIRTLSDVCLFLVLWNHFFSRGVS